MKATTLLCVFSAIAVVACDAATPAETLLAPVQSPTRPNGREVTDRSTPIVPASALMGSWQATRVTAWAWTSPGSPRDLVAEGGTVTLLLEPNTQLVGYAVPHGRYTITVIMPGEKRGIDTGFWCFGPAWQPQNQGHLQIDFYPNSLGPDWEYGLLPGFLVSLSDDQRTLKLWDAGLSFLPYDFGWGRFETVLELDFVRQ